LIAAKLSEVFGHQVVIDNRPGAGSAIGSEIVARALPDGYTLLLTGTPFAVLPALYSKLPFDSVLDVPTIAESGVPGYDAATWFGLFAPRGTPAIAINRLHGEIVKVLRLPDVENGYLISGNVAVTSRPEVFGAFIKAEIAKWGRVVREARIQGE
jgi:tripartite-type tricarboxylate transporter receptor subunit TctC